jgi:hypothetical protein
MIAKKAHITSSSTLLPPLSSEAAACQVLSIKLSTRTLQLLSQHIVNLHFDSLHEQIYEISELLVGDIQIAVTGTDLSSRFGRKGSWSRGIITEYLYQLSA